MKTLVESAERYLEEDHKPREGIMLSPSIIVIDDKGEYNDVEKRKQLQDELTRVILRYLNDNVVLYEPRIGPRDEHHIIWNT